MIKLYQESDALFIPVINATANNSILEALASGTPVISTDVGGVKDYVDETCGWLLPEGNVQAAFSHIKRLSTNRTLAQALRIGARIRAETFSWERIAKKIRLGYQRVLSGGTFAPSSSSERS